MDGQGNFPSLIPSHMQKKNPIADIMTMVNNATSTNRRWKVSDDDTQDRVDVDKQVEVTQVLSDSELMYSTLHPQKPKRK